MLEGQEISEIRLSELERTKRIDSDFYSKKNIEDLKKLVSIKAQSITNFVSVSDGNHMSISEDYCDEGIPYYRGTDIYNFFIEQASNNLKIEKRIFDTPNMRRSHLKKGDILMSIVGAIIGNLSLVKTDADATCSCKLAIMRPKKIQSEFFAVYLKSAYGQNQIQKFKRGSAQTGLILEDFEQILIPDFSDKLITSVTEIVNYAFAVLEQSKNSYAKAEQVLLEAVGLADFKPSTQNTNIKTFAQSFGTSGRLDAEYYQPKYEDYLKLIFDYKDGWAKLAEICTLKDANFNPTNETNYQYIELSDIDKSGGISGCTKDIGENLPSRARRFVNAGDVVVSSIEGSLSSCALVPTEYDNSLCSTGFYVIKSQEISSETLLVLMKSELMQNILKQSCSGTILTAMNKDEFSNLPIPKIDLTTQTNISQFVQQSFSLKAQSEHLLSVAKRAVEIAIEQDEAAAMHFIENSQ